MSTTQERNGEETATPRRRPSLLRSKIPKHKATVDTKWLHKLEDDSDSDISTGDNFLSKGAFLLTTTHDIPMDRIALVCERVHFKGCFSLTKTATGVLFKFSHPDDYQTMMKMGFHKVTGARFYRKIPIPCRPRKTFVLYILDVPDEIPVEDIRHAMFKFNSVMEVVRLHIYKANQPPPQPPTVEKSMESLSGKSDLIEQFERAEMREQPPAVIRITLASFDEYNMLLQNGFNFYDATFFPTEPHVPMKGMKVDLKQGIMDSDASGCVHNLLPVFDSTSPYSKLATLPSSGKHIKTAARS